MEEPKRRPFDWAKFVFFFGLVVQTVSLVYTPLAGSAGMGTVSRSTLRSIIIAICAGDVGIPLTAYVAGFIYGIHRTHSKNPRTYKPDANFTGWNFLGMCGSVVLAAAGFVAYLR